MFKKKWNLEKDRIIIDASPLFRLDKAKEIAKSYYPHFVFTNTKMGVFVEQRKDDRVDVILIKKNAMFTVMKNTFFAAIEKNGTCAVAHNYRKNANYLIDSRGVWFALPQTPKNTFLGSGHYEMFLDKKSGKIIVREKTGKILWKIKYLSDKQVEEYTVATAPFLKMSVNKEYLNFVKNTKLEVKNNSKYLYLTCGENKQGAIIKWLMDKGLPYEKVPNFFIDDETFNIRIKIDEITSKEDMVLFVATKYDNNYSMFNISIRQYLSELDNAYLIKSRFRFGKKKLNENQKCMCRSIINTMKMALNIEEDVEIYEKFFEPILQTMYLGVNRYQNDEFSYFFVPTNDGEVDSIKNPFANKNHFQQYESALLIRMKEEGVKINKWKNEAEMFVLIHKVFPDAVYQYRDEWLGKQSLDVYVPSKKVAFEYQGIQHFKAIDHFGGEEALVQRQEQDKKKHMLCEKQNVKLIYWNYDEPINEMVLNKKMIET